MEKGSGSLTQSYLRKEINDLQKKYDAIKAQQKQEEKVKEKIEAESRLKLRQIQRLQDEIRWLQEQHYLYVNLHYSIRTLSSCISRTKAELSQQTSDIERYWQKTLNDVKAKQKSLIIELAASDDLMNEHEHLKRRFDSDLQEYRVSLLENSIFLNLRTEYNFDMTIKFDQILREFVTSLYLEENQSKEVRTAIHRFDCNLRCSTYSASSSEGGGDKSSFRLGHISQTQHGCSSRGGGVEQSRM